MFYEQINYGKKIIRNYICDICEKEIELEKITEKEFSYSLKELGWFKKKVCNRFYHFCSDDCFEQF